MPNNKYNEEMEKAVLVGAIESNDKDFNISFEELSELTKACNINPVGTITQNINTIDPASYIGSGKVIELKNLCEYLGASTVIFNNTLSPSQFSNLSDILSVKIMDRSSLILNIFKKRAKSHEAKLQVEYAELSYTLPRLKGIGINMSRQAGSSGSMSSRGQGEKKLELDRRHIEHRMSELRREIKEVEKTREIKRLQRKRSDLPLVSLVGYTNAGKSTVLNAIIDKYCNDENKKVFVKNMLFASLDTNVRRIDIEDKYSFLLSDTVGFVSRLPHGLVASFKSTLRELEESDLIIELVDFSDKNHSSQMEVTKKTIKESNAGAVPIIHVMNKSERMLPENELPKKLGDKVFISALNENHIKYLVDIICEKLFNHYIELEMLIPYDKAGLENSLREKAIVKSSEYIDDGIKIKLSIDPQYIKPYKNFII